MEGKSTAQKRQEHVWRLLSWLVKRVMDRDEDGLVPFAPLGQEPSLLDRVRGALESLFPGRDPGQVETEIVNELKQAVKGYRRADSLADWLANCYFDFHVSLYRNRPIVWHIASSQGTAPMAFGALVHYHRFDGNRLAKLRAQHLRETADACRREAAQADKDGRAADALEWRARLEEVENLDRRLAWVQEGRHEGPAGGNRDYRILTPWKSAAQRPKGWDPDLDDGVKVNIEPLQKAGVLRVAKIVCEACTPEPRCRISRTSLTRKTAVGGFKIPFGLSPSTPLRRALSKGERNFERHPMGERRKAAHALRLRSGEPSTGLSTNGFSAFQLPFLG